MMDQGGKQVRCRISLRSDSLVVASDVTLIGTYEGSGQNLGHTWARTGGLAYYIVGLTWIERGPDYIGWRYVIRHATSRLMTNLDNDQGLSPVSRAPFS